MPSTGNIKLTRSIGSPLERDRVVWPSDALKRGGDSAIKDPHGDGRRGSHPWRVVASRGARDRPCPRVAKALLRAVRRYRGLLLGELRLGGGSGTGRRRGDGGRWAKLARADPWRPGRAAALLRRAAVAGSTLRGARDGWRSACARGPGAGDGRAIRGGRPWAHADLGAARAGSSRRRRDRGRSGGGALHASARAQRRREQ